MKILPAIKVFCVAATVAGFAWFIHHIGVDKIATAVASFGKHFIWLLIITSLAYLLGTIGWRYCLPEKYQSVSLFKLFAIRLIGEAISLVNPLGFVGGESSKVYLLGKEGIDKKAGISSVLLARLVMIISQFFLLSLVLIWLYANNQLPALHFTIKPLYFLGCLLLVIVLVLLRRFVKSKKTNQHTKSKQRLFWLRVRLGVHSAKQSLQQLLQFVITQKKDFLLSFVFHGLHWIVGAAEFYIILFLLDVKITLVQALLIDMGVVIIKSAGWMVPGQAGVEEYGNKLMLTTVGVYAAEVWLAASLLRRARQLCWIAIGLVGYFIYVKYKRLLPASDDGSIVCKS